MTMAATVVGTLRQCRAYCIVATLYVVKLYYMWSVIAATQCGCSWSFGCCNQLKTSQFRLIEPVSLSSGNQRGLVLVGSVLVQAEGVKQETSPGPSPSKLGQKLDQTRLLNTILVTGPEGTKYKCSATAAWTSTACARRQINSRH